MGLLKYQMVGHGSGELDVAHAVATHLGRGDLDAAALADDALKADALYLPQEHSQSLAGPKIFSQNRPSFSGLSVAVVDGLGLFDLAVAPSADLLRGSKADFNGIENVVFHETNPFLISSCLDDTGGFLVQTTGPSPLPQHAEQGA